MMKALNWEVSSIQNDCLIAPGSCARYLGGLLEVPCEALNHGTLWEKTGQGRESEKPSVQ